MPTQRSSFFRALTVTAIWRWLSRRVVPVVMAGIKIPACRRGRMSVVTPWFLLRDYLALVWRDAVVTLHDLSRSAAHCGAGGYVAGHLSNGFPGADRNQCFLLPVPCCANLRPLQYILLARPLRCGTADSDYTSGVDAGVR